MTVTLGIYIFIICERVKRDQRSSGQRRAGGRWTDFWPAHARTKLLPFQTIKYIIYTYIIQCSRNIFRTDDDSDGLRVWTIILIFNNNSNNNTYTYVYSPSNSARLAFGYIIIPLPDLLAALEIVSSSLARRHATGNASISALETRIFYLYICMHEKIINAKVVDPEGLWQVSYFPLFCSNVSQSAISISLYLQLWSVYLSVCPPLQRASQPVIR